jgi:hypothetical protein
MSLTRDGMLVNLSIPGIGVSRKDKAATKYVAEEFEASSERVGGYMKKLFRPGIWKDVNSVLSEIERYHRANTKPWSDTMALRLLLVTDFQSYSKRMREFNDKLAQAVNRVTDNWNRHIEDSKVFLGPKLFDITAYPDPEEVKGKLKIKVNFYPMPTSGDWRIETTESDLEVLKLETETQMKNSLATATRDCFEKIAEVFQPFFERLASDNPDIRKGACERINKVASSMKKWNAYLGNPDLDKIITRIEKDLSGLDEFSLNANPGLRGKAKAVADEVAATIKEYI